MRASLRTLALCLAFASAMQPTHAQTYTPLNLDQTVELITGGLTSKRVVTLVGERGVDYTLTPIALERLKTADADEIVAVGTNYRAPAPKPAPQPAPTPVPQPSPALPADIASASLPETMQFIQTHIAQYATVTYSFHSHNPDGRHTDINNTKAFQISRVVANPSNCSISFHQRSMQNGKVFQDLDQSVYLSAAQFATIETGEQKEQRLDAAVGHPNLEYTFGPTIYWVETEPSGLIGFPFSDPAEADRVSAAIVHAARLCRR
jgi:hypothetical protein